MVRKQLEVAGHRPSGIPHVDHRNAAWLENAKALRIDPVQLLMHALPSLPGLIRLEQFPNVRIQSRKLSVPHLNQWVRR